MGVCVSTEDHDTLPGDDEFSSAYNTESFNQQQQQEEQFAFLSLDEFTAAAGAFATAVGKHAPECAIESTTQVIRRGLLDNREILTRCLFEILDHTRTGSVTPSQHERVNQMFARIDSCGAAEFESELLIAVADLPAEKLKHADLSALQLSHFCHSVLAATGTTAHVLTDMVPKLMAQPSLRAEFRTQLQDELSHTDGSRLQVGKALIRILEAAVCADSERSEALSQVLSQMSMELPEHLEEVSLWSIRAIPN